MELQEAQQDCCAVPVGPEFHATIVSGMLIGREYVSHIRQYFYRFGPILNTLARLPASPDGIGRQQVAMVGGQQEPYVQVKQERNSLQQN